MGDLRRVGLLAVAVGVAATATTAAAAGHNSPAHPRKPPCGRRFPCSPPPPPQSSPSPAPPAPAPPTPAAYGGSAYDGHDGTRVYSELGVAPSGGGLAGFEFVFHRGRCSDGETDNDGIGMALTGQAQLDGQGRVSYSHLFRRAYTFDRAGRRVNGHEFVQFNATFQGQQANGVFSDRFTSRRMSCHSGQVSFVVYRDGTPQAPLQNDSVATGTYRGPEQQEYAPGAHPPPRRFKLVVFLPWDLAKLVLPWDLICGNRLFEQRYVFASLPIVRQGALGPGFALQRHGTVRLKHGVIGRWSSSLRTLFQAAQSGFNRRTYSVWGHFSFVVRYFQGRAQVGGCDQSLGFSGNGPSGPTS